MFNTTQTYKDNIYSPIRTVFGKVTFDISDVTAVGDIADITTSTEFTVSDKTQLTNKVRDATYKLATCETNRFKLDGSFSFADDSENGEVGFVSDGLCDAAGAFTDYPTITFTFGSTHSSVGLTITFDELTGEYATDYDVTAYDESDNVIQTVSIVGNTDVIAEPLGQLSGYKKIAITIKKWSIGNRRARVLEVDFGIIRIYTDSNLISMNLIEEMDITTGTLPSPEFKFTVDNSLREFNILNPSGFYRYLQEQQTVEAKLGLDVGSGVIEYVPLGFYYLNEWTSDEGSLTATFTARTALDRMATFDYENLVPISKTLYQLAEEIFALCNITNYEIDPALGSIMTDSLVKKTNCKNVLQMISIAGCGNVFVTRDNIITLKVLSMGSAVDEVTLDEMYSEPKIDLDKVVKSVSVTWFTDLETSSIETVESTATNGDSLKLESNTLINSSERAIAVATWILSQKNLRAIYRADWRGNMAHELSDVVKLENGYGVDMTVFVTKNEINYQGYLAQKTEARGAVV